MSRATKTGGVPEVKYITGRMYGVHEPIDKNMVDDDDEMYEHDPEE